MAVLTIEHLTVKKDRIVAEVTVCSPEHAFTNPHVIQVVLRYYPHLLEHSCVNKKGSTFGCVAEDTSLPHLLEHMVIEEQAHSENPHSQACVLYKGKTYWTDRARLRACVEVSFADDLVALRAFRIASERLNAAVLQ